LIMRLFQDETKPSKHLLKPPSRSDTPLRKCDASKVWVVYVSRGYDFGFHALSAFCVQAMDFLFQIRPSCVCHTAYAFVTWSTNLKAGNSEIVV